MTLSALAGMKSYCFWSACALRSRKKSASVNPPKEPTVRKLRRERLFPKHFIIAEFRTKLEAGSKRAIESEAQGQSFLLDGTSNSASCHNQLSRASQSDGRTVRCFRALRVGVGRWADASGAASVGSIIDTALQHVKGFGVPQNEGRTFSVQLYVARRTFESRAFSHGRSKHSL